MENAKKEIESADDINITEEQYIYCNTLVHSNKALQHWSSPRSPLRVHWKTKKKTKKFFFYKKGRKKITILKKVNEIAVLLDNGAEHTGDTKVGGIRRTEQILLRWIFDVGTEYGNILSNRFPYNGYQRTVFCIWVSGWHSILFFFKYILELNHEYSLIYNIISRFFFKLAVRIWLST